VIFGIIWTTLMATALIVSVQQSPIASLPAGLLVASGIWITYRWLTLSVAANNGDLVVRNF